MERGPDYMPSSKALEDAPEVSFQKLLPKKKLILYSCLTILNTAWLVVKIIEMYSLAQG